MSVVYDISYVKEAALTFCLNGWSSTDAGSYDTFLDFLLQETDQRWVLPHYFCSHFSIVLSTTTRDVIFLQIRWRQRENLSVSWMKPEKSRNYLLHTIKSEHSLLTAFMREIVMNLLRRSLSTLMASEAPKIGPKCSKLYNASKHCNSYKNCLISSLTSFINSRLTLVS
jgi:hypothetical protein